MLTVKMSRNFLRRKRITFYRPQPTREQSGYRKCVIARTPALPNLPSAKLLQTPGPPQHRRRSTGQRLSLLAAFWRPVWIRAPLPAVLSAGVDRFAEQYLRLRGKNKANTVWGVSWQAGRRAECEEPETRQSREE